MRDENEEREKRPWTKRPPVNGGLIRAARIRKGMTLDDVQQECRQLGVPVWNLSRIENGKLPWPHPRAIVALAEVLGLDTDDMMQAAA